MASTTIGYRYFFGIHMGLCRGPANHIVQIKVGDRLAFGGTPDEGGVLQSLSHEETDIDKPDLFGGEDGEGGVVGHLMCLFGDDVQVAPVELLAMYGETELPGYRKTTTVFFDGQISAMNPYPKPWKFRIRAQGINPMGLGVPVSGTIIIPTDPDDTVLHSPTKIYAMNPVGIIGQVLLDRTWGRGLPASMIDVTSFNNAFTQLIAEQFGLCLKWSRTDSVDSFIQSILDHIGATLYTDRQTGLLNLKLIRADYDPELVPLFSQELGVVEISEATVVANSPLINEVRITYRDPITNEDRIVVARNPASLQGEGQGVVSQTKEYKGLPTADLAMKVAQRDLKSQGGHLRRFTIKMNRIGWKIAPGGVIKIQDLARGILPTIVRVGAIEDGGLGDGGVTIRAVQDVFALPSTTFAGSEPPRWEPPGTTPCVGEHKVFELPYFLLQRTLPKADFDAIDDESGYLGTVVAKGQPLNIAYKIAVRNDAPTPDDDAAEGYFCEGYTP